MQRSNPLAALFLAATLAMLGNLYLESSQRLLAVGSPWPIAQPAASEAQGLVALTSGQVLDGFGAWSPDGSRIALMRGGRIMELSLAGGEPTALTDPAPTGWDVNATYAPDGQALLFIRQPNGSGEYRLMRLARGAIEAETLLASRLPIGYAAYSPDGSRVAFSSTGGIYQLELASGQVRPIYEEAGRRFLEGGLAWHPRGHGLVAGFGSAEVGEAFDLWWLPAGGSPTPQPPGSAPVATTPEVRRLTQQGGIMPAFTPDGETIYYRRPKQESGIWRLNLAALESQPVIKDRKTQLYFHPAVSPDGKRLVVSRLTLGGEQLTSALYQFSLSP